MQRGWLMSRLPSACSLPWKQPQSFLQPNSFSSVPLYLSSYGIHTQGMLACMVASCMLLPGC